MNARGIMSVNVVWNGCTNKSFLTVGKDVLIHFDFPSNNCTFHSVLGVHLQSPVDSFQTNSVYTCANMLYKEIFPKVRQLRMIYMCIAQLEELRNLPPSKCCPFLGLILNALKLQ